MHYTSLALYCFVELRTRNRWRAIHTIKCLPEVTSYTCKHILIWVLRAQITMYIWSQRQNRQNTYLFWYPAHMFDFSLTWCRPENLISICYGLHEQHVNVRVNCSECLIGRVYIWKSQHDRTFAIRRVELYNSFGVCHGSVFTQIAQPQRYCFALRPVVQGCTFSAVILRSSPSDICQQHRFTVKIRSYFSKVLHCKWEKKNILHKTHKMKL